ncbi:MAG: hypothetical protein GTO33_12950, partial [Acidobacteria bacterium]|nr:hypothetical protein [Acidobacteriota bacterium]NIO60216.1 hypothetical protein [Acidobacteriota bacterium]NIT11877.1 hypothetical protein [Acidobacteriota bacterium]
MAAEVAEAPAAEPEAAAEPEPVVAPEEAALAEAVAPPEPEAYVEDDGTDEEADNVLIVQEGITAHEFARMVGTRTGE